MRIACILDGEDHGSNFYRGILPMKALKEHSKDIKVMVIRRGDPIPIVRRALESDLYVVPRFAATEMMPKFEGLKISGKKLVTDYDDNVFHVSPLSPHYSHFGTNEVNYFLENGEVLNLWEHGRNINIVENKQRLEGIKESIGKSDCLTVTTEILAECYSELVDNITVLPNCIDLRVWNKLPLAKTDEIRLIWAGGASHYEDWHLIQDVLAEIVRKYPKVKLVILGQFFKGVLNKIPRERIEFHEWVHSEAYPYKIAILNPDISIIPLVNNQFNICKSSIKFVEMSALEVPSVVSYVSPYKELMDDNNGVFIEDNDLEGWFKGISMLIEDVGMREYVGKCARKYIEDRYDINKEYVQWENVYKGLLCKA